MMTPAAPAQQGEDDAAAQRQEQDQRGGEDGVLPVLGERAGQRDGGAEDGADGGGPGTVEEGAHAGVRRIRSNRGRRAGRTRTTGENATTEARSAADEAGGRVADDGDGVDDRARGDLAEGDGVEELRAGHPVVVATASDCMSGMMTNPPP